MVDGPRLGQLKDDEGMKPGIPWSVKGIEPEAREAAKLAARRAGLTLGEWLNSVIFDQSAHNVGATQFDSHAWESLVSTAPPPPEPPRPEPQPRTRTGRAAAERRDDNALRLQDIAQQLADLAKREHVTAPPPQPEPGPAEREEFERIIERIEDTERQTVEALTAVNERLTRLSQQVGQAARPRGFDRPEDVPGYTALEQAIRNVVEHIEVSEKRTRDSLRAMQDRLAEMTERDSLPPSGEDILRAAPVLSGLDSRLADMINRMQRSEGLLSERIEGVKASAQQMAHQAQSSAVTAVRGELREVETRVLASLKEAQAAASNTPPMIANEIAKLHGDMAGLARRLDEVKAGAAGERDLQSLRVALEQLSARVAQGPDMRPLADMDKRLGDINRRLEIAAAASREAPQVGALEQRIAELDHRLAEAVRLQGDQRAVRHLEDSIASVNSRLAQTEQQLSHLETMEQAIRQLYDSIEQTRATAGEAAEAAASRALERYQPPQAFAGSSPELQALEEGLRAVRESVSGVERRNQETFEAVHETLSEIVDRIAELESAPRAQLAAAPLPPSEPPLITEAQMTAAPMAEAPRMPEPRMPDPRMAEPLRAEEPYMPPPDARAPDLAAPMAGAQEALSAGDDFIAAARRAAQAAAARPSSLRAEYGASAPPATEGKGSSSSFLQRLRRKPADAASTAEPRLRGLEPAPAQSSSRRRTLILAGLLLLVAASVFAYRSLSGPPPQPAQSSRMEVPAPALPAPSPASAKQTLVTTKTADPIVTGSVSRSQAPPAAPPLEAPPPALGTEALRMAAAEGDPRAQFIIAGRYLDGQGTETDYAKALYWYRQAATRGLAPAQYRLATMYERGKGAAADPAQALAWYERAATGGNIKAMHNAAVLAAGDSAGPADFDKAFRWFKAAAARGFGDSQFNLAILYERGLGTSPSKEEAYLWYSLAGAQGDADSAQRAASLAKQLPDMELKALGLRLSAWAPTPSDDSANVVTVVDPAWTSGANATLVRPSS